MVFFVVDLFRLGLAAEGLYQRHAVGGILVFVLIPALRGETTTLRAAVIGGLLGLFNYGTFGLTRLVLIRAVAVRPLPSPIWRGERF